MHIDPDHDLENIVEDTAESWEVHNMRDMQPRSDRGELRRRRTGGSSGAKEVPKWLEGACVFAPMYFIFITKIIHTPPSFPKQHLHS